MKKKILSMLLLLLLLFTGCSSGKQEQPATPVDIRVLALKGPTGMGLLQLMSDVDEGRVESNHYSIEIASAVDQVSAAIGHGDVDIAAVPANLASILYHNTDRGIVVLGVNTLGVLYIVENGDEIHSIEDLRGKTIFASGKGATPEYALNYLLSENGLDPASDVDIQWKSEHTECLAAFAEGQHAIAMLPQPFVTIAEGKVENMRTAIDMTAAWDALQESEDAPSSMITGVVVARRAFVEENPSAVADFMDRYAASVAFVNTELDEAAALAENYGIVPKAPVAKKAIPACNIVLMTGDEMHSRLSGYLTVLYNQNPKAVGGALPEDDFYYSCD